MNHLKEAERMIYHQPLVAIAHALLAIAQQMKEENNA
jgi:hypothetical protein